MPAGFGGGRRRRRHSDEFKADAVAACVQPGVSMAAVAMAHGINANLLRRWVRDAEMKVDPAVEDRSSSVPAAVPAAAFVPMTLPPAATSTAADIRIELRRGPMSVVVTWPSSAATECANWIRELLR